MSDHTIMSTAKTRATNRAIAELIGAGETSAEEMTAEKIRGVNLGNWLVLERWMEPELFRGTDAEDETWLRRLLPAKELERRLKEHRESWITEADLKWIAGQGLNLVRIPVPWFLFGDRAPYESCVEYLDRAFLWAERYGLKVLIDLHTTPGNQNGYDNGGLVGVCRWHRDPEEVEYVLTVLTRLGERYGNREGLFGIEVLNEPISWLVYHTAPTTGRARDREESRGSGHVPLKFLRTFYLEAYRRLREVMPEDKAVVFHDGFRLTAWNAFFRRGGMKNVYLDTHQYIWAMEMFLPLHRPFVYRMFLRHAERQIRKVQKAVPVLVGEWCICTRHASFLRNHRYEGKGTDILGTRLKELSEFTDSVMADADRHRGLVGKLEQKAAGAVPGGVGDGAPDLGKHCGLDLLELQALRKQKTDRG